MAHQPNESDRVVKVRAYLTDETFGYEHWRAAQFSAPDNACPAVLIVCLSPEEQARLLARFNEEFPR